MNNKEKKQTPFFKSVQISKEKKENILKFKKVILLKIVQKKKMI